LAKFPGSSSATTAASVPVPAPALPGCVINAGENKWMWKLHNANACTCLIILIGLKHMCSKMNLAQSIGENM
jgi:hypothetical protein